MRFSKQTRNFLHYFFWSFYCFGMLVTIIKTIPNEGLYNSRIINLIIDLGFSLFVYSILHLPIDAWLGVLYVFCVLVFLALIAHLCLADGDDGYIDSLAHTILGAVWLNFTLSAVPHAYQTLGFDYMQMLRFISIFSGIYILLNLSTIPFLTYFKNLKTISFSAISILLNIGLPSLMPVALLIMIRPDNGYIASSKINGLFITTTLMVFLSVIIALFVIYIFEQYTKKKLIERIKRY